MKKDEIPQQEPKWLESKYTPINDGNYIMMNDYPNLISSEVLEKRIENREKKAKKDNKKAKKDNKKVLPIYFEATNPIEWLRRCYWCKLKMFKTTLILNPRDTIIDLGDGDLNCFEYLKY